MKNKRNKALAFMLVTSMVLASPVSVNAGIIERDKQEDAKDQEIYVEGEAIIQYIDSKVNAKTFQTGKGILEDVEIVETYDFAQKDVDEKSIKSISQKGETGFKISLVRSEKYSTEELINKLKEDSNIQYAEPNYKLHIKSTDDQYFKYQWALDNQGQNGGTIDCDVQADTLNTSKEKEEKVIALIDTGINYEHEDLKDVVWTNTQISKTFKGKHGYDFANEDDDPMDDQGHGTHCAGILAATANNQKGIAGVATNVKIMSLKVFDNIGLGSAIEAIGAYNYIYKAQREGVNIVAVNNSWGSHFYREYDDIFKEMIDLVGENGAVTVCAVGNDRFDNDKTFLSPANIDSPYIISVTASNENDELATFASYGKTTVDLAAPGTDILSSVVYNTFNPGIYEDKQALCQRYESFEGVSLVQVLDNDGYIENVDSKTGESEEKDSADKKILEKDEEVSDTDDVKGNVFEYGMNNSEGIGEAKVELSKDVFFGEKTDKSAALKWSITGAKKDDLYELYIPYDVAISNTSTYASAMIRVNGPEDKFDRNSRCGRFDISDSTLDDQGRYDEKSEIFFDGLFFGKENYWNHFMQKVSSATKTEKKRALKFTLTVGKDGDYEVYVDDFGISKENVKEQAFGKYDFYNGTSMATPYVTGAVATVAGLYPEEDVLDRKGRIIGSVRKVDALKDLTVTGGVLDFTNIRDPKITLEKLEEKENGTLHISGYNLKDSVVTIDGKKVQPINIDDKNIDVDVSSYKNTLIEVQVQKGEVTLTENFFVATGEGFCNGTTGDFNIYGGGVVSDGQRLFYINEDGGVYSADMEKFFLKRQEEDEESDDENNEGTNEMSFDFADCQYNQNMFGDEFIHNLDYEIEAVTDYVYSNHTIYTAVKLDAGYSEKTILAAYSVDNQDIQEENDDERNEGKWSFVEEIPDEITDLDGYTLTVYDGNLYIFGGFDRSKEQASKQVYKAEIKENSGTFEKMDLELPEGRCFAKAIQVDDKLVITLGSTGKGTDIPSNIIFDGEKFTVSEANIGDAYGYKDFTYENSNKKKTTVAYYDTSIGLVKDGVIYTGLKVEKLGDTFSYNVKKDQYETTGYAFAKSELCGDTTFAATADNKLYVINGNNYGTDMVEIRSIDVERGNVAVQDVSTEGAFVNGAGYYLPGEMLVLTPEAEEGYELKEFTVNGEVVEDNEWSGIAPIGGSTITAAATVVEVEETDTDEDETKEQNPADGDAAKEDSEKNEVKEPEKTESETKEQSPANGEPTKDNSEKATQNSAATSNNTSVTPSPVTPNKITTQPSNDTTGGTVTNPSGSNSNTKKEVKKGDVVTRGNLKYKVTKATASKKTVTVTATTDQKVKNVKVPNTITIDGNKYNVTAIADKAFANCKKLKTVTINKNITKVGKNLFKGCKKLKTVTFKGTKSSIKKKIEKQAREVKKRKQNDIS